MAVFCGLAHIAVRTSNLPGSIQFYKKMGGIVLKEDHVYSSEGDKTLVLISLGDIILELIQSYSPVPDGIYAHIAFYVQDIQKAASELITAGAVPNTPSEKHTYLFGGMINWFLTGPSGEQIELIQTVK